MRRGRRHRRALAVVVTAAVVALGGGVQALAQLVPGSQQTGDSTTTTAPPASTTSTTAPLGELFTTTTAPPGGATTTTTPPPSEPGAPAPVAPGLPPDPTADEGDGGDGAGVGRVVPPEAQAIIDSIPRTPPGNNDALVQGAAMLEAAGVPHDEAVRVVFGRFPVLGPTRWSDDWFYPRWTGSQFRFHQGLDMFAPYGTPVAAPVDGVAVIGQNPLGGLTVKVVEADGTYWYLAHLSGTAPGLVSGQAVSTGQVVGYVGTSGNAVGTPPHLHFGIYPQGGAAAPPKPVVDAWVVEGAARVPELLAQLGAAPAPAPGPRAVGTEVGPPTAETPWRSELLWASAASPTGGALQVAEAAAAAASGELDWEQRAAQQRALDLAWASSRDRAVQILAPLTNPWLRRAVAALRAAPA